MKRQSWLDQGWALVVGFVTTNESQMGWLMGSESNQWEFPDPKMKLLSHIRPYVLGIFPYIGLLYGRYLQFRFLEMATDQI